MGECHGELQPAEQATAKKRSGDGLRAEPRRMMSMPKVQPAGSDNGDGFKDSLVSSFAGRMADAMRQGVFPALALAKRHALTGAQLEGP